MEEYTQSIEQIKEYTVVMFQNGIIAVVLKDNNGELGIYRKADLCLYNKAFVSVSDYHKDLEHKSISRIDIKAYTNNMSSVNAIMSVLQDREIVFDQVCPKIYKSGWVTRNRMFVEDLDDLDIAEQVNLEFIEFWSKEEWEFWRDGACGCKCVYINTCTKPC